MVYIVTVYLVNMYHNILYLVSNHYGLIGQKVCVKTLITLDIY